MPYPHDGTPNTRPEAGPPGRGAPGWRYDPELSLTELFAEFIDLSGSIIDENTQRVYGYDWAMFIEYLLLDERKGAEDLTSKAPLPLTLASLNETVLVHYFAWLGSRDMKKGTGKLSKDAINHYARPVRTFIRWLVAQGYYPYDPPEGGKHGIMPKLGTPILKTAQPAGVELLLRGSELGTARGKFGRALRERDRLIVLLGTDTGMRTNDVCSVPIENIDLEAGIATIVKAKGDKERIVPISREVVGVIRSYLRRTRPVLTGMSANAVRGVEPLVVAATGEALTSGGLYQAMCRAYLRGGGKKRFGLHRLRHMFGTAAVEGKMQIAVSLAIMGHVDEKSQRPYQHPSQATLVREHALITPMNNIKSSRRRRLA